MAGAHDVQDGGSAFPGSLQGARPCLRQRERRMAPSTSGSLSRCWFGSSLHAGTWREQLPEDADVPGLRARQWEHSWAQRGAQLLGHAPATMVATRRANGNLLLFLMFIFQICNCKIPATTNSLLQSPACRSALVCAKEVSHSQTPAGLGTRADAGQAVLGE